MKTKEEIEQLAEKEYREYPNNPIDKEDWYYNRDDNCHKKRKAFVKGYTQCQEDNDWTKGCNCKDSIGQTWCCNKCGLPYDTRKSDKKYTEEDMLNASKYGYEFRDTTSFPEHKFEDSCINNTKQWIHTLNKQD